MQSSTCDNHVTVMSECSSAAMQDEAVIWQIAIINSRAEEESEG